MAIVRALSLANPAVVEMSIGTFLGASEIEVTPFQASGTLGIDFTVVSNWSAQGSSYPGDMALAIVSPDGTVFGVDGYNTNTGGVGYPPNYLDDWPSDWNTSSAGVYYAQFTIPEGVTGDGVWSVVVMNAWTTSQTAEYDLNDRDQRPLHRRLEAQPEVSCFIVSIVSD